MANKIYTIDEIKLIVQQIAQQYDIPVVYLFGSYARGQASDTSDIDFAIDSRNLHGLLDLVKVRMSMEDQLDKSIDLVTIRAIERKKGEPYRKAFTENYYRERIPIYVQ